MKIRWIHFSDLHLGDDRAVDTRRMRKKLTGYIASLNQTFEYAFCTGDVKQWDSDYSTAPDYIRSLCNASHTPLDHLFIVPGNHDVKRGGDERTNLIDRITDWKSDYYRSIDGYISEQDYATLKSGQDNFRTFIAEFLGCDRAEKYDAPHFVITIEHLNISGVSVNPAILTELEVGSSVFINDKDSLPLTRVMDKLWSDKLDNSELSCNALILGDGGMGKSTMMFHECQRLLSERQLSVYISLQVREGTGNESLRGYILRCLYKAEDERAKGKLHRLTASMHPHPDLVLFIDGFNELSGEGAQRYVAEIKDLSQCPGIQIIVSSRLDFLRDYGLSHFGMIHTCDLRESQIEQLFRERPDDWHQVLAQKNLRILLRNPMMALLYASTCPIMERHSDLDYLGWIMPVTNASDLLHDYYMAQIALLVDRQSIDGNHIFECMVAIDRLLPFLAYEAERNNTIAWAEPEFDAKLRDCLAATYLHNCLLDQISVDRLWHKEEIHKGVVQYLRFIGSEAAWGATGTVSEILNLSGPLQMHQE